MMDKFRAIALIFIMAVLATAAEWQVQKSDKNLVKFVSDAPIEDFEGITSDIDGYIYWAGENILDKSELYFEVDLNTLDTGIGLRNRHMRENYLETEKFPSTSFKGSCIKIEELGRGKFKVQVQGKMSLHGIERLKTVEGIIERENKTLRITSTFPVKLSDYGITVPSIMFYKIDEIMELSVDFKLVQANSE